MPGESQKRELEDANDEKSSSVRSRRLLVLPLAGSIAPIAGIVTAPLLTHSLGVDGRGAAAAALAPYSLIANIATLGLPEALTYFIARHPGHARNVVARATLYSTPLAAFAAIAAYILAPALSAGSAELAEFMGIASLAAVPAVWVGLLRGAAYGRLQWNLIAYEQVISAFLRIGALVALAATGLLTVPTAVLVGVTIPIVAGFVYLPILGPDGTRDGAPSIHGIRHPILSYGMRVWASSIAGIIYGRLGQLILTPLAGVQQLGLFVVAITISDAPLLIAGALKEGVFGVASREADPLWLAMASRVITLGVLVGSLFLGVTLPLWIGFVFGRDFYAAIPATWALLTAATLSVPAVIAGAGLGAWNRPGIKSVIVIMTMLVNMATFFALTPSLGAFGAGLAGIVSSTFSSIATVALAARTLNVPPLAFVIPTPRDFNIVRELVKSRLRRHGKGSADV